MTKRRANRFGSAACLAAALSVAAVATAHAETKGNDWILLIDTSNSIIGQGTHAKNISVKYKRSIKSFLQADLRPGDRLYAYTFDEQPVFQRFFQTTDQSSVAALQSVFDDQVFQPHGGCTHIGDAIDLAVTRARYLRDAGRPAPIVLFTDGIDTCRTASSKTMADFPTEPMSERDFPFGFYVVWAGSKSDLGKLRDRFPADVRRQLHILEPEQSASVVDQVRAVSPLSLETTAKTVDFGSVYRGKKTSDAVLRISATKAAAVQLNLAGGVGEGFRLSGIKQPVLLKRGDNDLSLSIDTDRSASPGIHDGFLEVRPADESSEPLLVFNVRVTTSRFWFSPIWIWAFSGLLFLASSILFVVARPKPSTERRVYVEPVIDPRLALLTRKQADLNQLKISIGDLERRCARLEREISDLTASLKG